MVKSSKDQIDIDRNKGKRETKAEEIDERNRAFTKIKKFISSASDRDDHLSFEFLSFTICSRSNLYSFQYSNCSLLIVLFSIRGYFSTLTLKFYCDALGIVNVKKCLVIYFSGA